LNSSSSSTSSLNLSSASSSSVNSSSSSSSTSSSSSSGSSSSLSSLSTESSLSSLSSSSLSSMGYFRVLCKIYYAPITLLQESTLFDTIDRQVKLYVESYTTDGFMVKYENFPTSTITEIYYYAL